MGYEEGVNLSMPVAPAYMSNGGNNGMGFGDNNGWWIILLLLCLGRNGGWGNGGGIGGGNSGDLYPWLNNSNQMNDGFRDQMLQTNISNVLSSITGGFSDVQMALCSGFASVTAAITAGQNALSQQLYTNQIADLERSFAAQTANTAAMTALQSQFADCCCKNQLATEGLRATILQENCADRYEAANNTRDIIDNANRNNQALMDKLCQLELDGIKQNYENRILGLQNALDQARLDNQSLRFTASQGAQTAQILADNARQTVTLEDYLNPVARPAYIVQNPNCCNQNSNCNCGCNNGYFNG